jgi:hypothetical protein
MQPYVTVWDGKFIQTMEQSAALAAAQAGTVQVWDGPRGYLPGWKMAESSDFPLAPVTLPAPTLTALTPDTAEQDVDPIEFVLSGTDFNNDTIVVIDGTDVPSVLVGPTELRATMNRLVAHDAQVHVRDALDRVSATLEFIITPAPGE